MTVKQLEKSIEIIHKELNSAFGVKVYKVTCNHILAIHEGKRIESIFEWLSKDRCYIKIYAPNGIKIIRDYKDSKDLINQFWLAFYD